MKIVYTGSSIISKNAIDQIRILKTNRKRPVSAWGLKG